MFGSLTYFLLPPGHVWNGRFVPMWYLGIYASCAYFLGAVLPSLLGLVWRRRADVVGVIALAVVAVVVLGGILEQRDETYVDDWIRANYGGYERQADWPKLEELMTHVAALPPGRVLWEPSLLMESFGTELAPMLMPYWAGHPSMEGLYYESGLTTPFHFLTVAEVAERPSNPIGTLPYRQFNLQRGIDHMELLDVSWYVTFTDLAKRAALRSPRLELVDEFGRFAIFAVDTPGQVVIPSVRAGRARGTALDRARTSRGSPTRTTWTSRSSPTGRPSGRGRAIPPIRRPRRSPAEASRCRPWSPTTRSRSTRTPSASPTGSRPRTSRTGRRRARWDPSSPPPR